ncbi:hypothetical protein MLD38_037921 [Melastoma candidum]|uniref:Uncharacterized protein n=1 Tax=Melastoma candidum TaxID=119954 RepID=A0ACB9KYG5_9MYRT|nr:hypothetical protein MLD38_037921 [Melastoma candidum]
MKNEKIDNVDGGEVVDLRLAPRACGLWRWDLDSGGVTDGDVDVDEVRGHFEKQGPCELTLARERKPRAVRAHPGGGTETKGSKSSPWRGNGNQGPYELTLLDILIASRLNDKNPRQCRRRTDNVVKNRFTILSKRRAIFEFSAKENDFTFINSNNKRVMSSFNGGIDKLTIQGTFIDTVDPKVTTLMQQAVLLGSLSMTVNEESTDQTLENAQNASRT